MMQFLYGDLQAHELVEMSEVDFTRFGPGQYYLMCADDELHNDNFIETWYCSDGTYANIEYTDPVVSSPLRSRKMYEKNNGVKLLYLIRVLMPYYFFKKYYM